MKESSSSDLYLRFEAVARHFGWSIRQLSVTLELPSPQVFYDLKSGKLQSVSRKILESLKRNLPEVSAAWILTGEGEMLRSAAEPAVKGETSPNHCADVVGRLMHYLEQTGSNKSRFERQVGLSNGFISHMSSQITFAALAKIASGAPDLNLGWLFSGVGPMFITTEPVIPEGEQQARDHDNARHREIVDIQQLIDDLRQDKERLLKEKAELWEMYKSAIAAAK